VYVVKDCIIMFNCPTEDEEVYKKNVNV